MNLSAQDEEHLRLLTMFHYVYAGLKALFACVPIIHVGLGILMLTGHFPPGPQSVPGVPVMVGMGSLFVILGVLFIVFGWVQAALVFAAGRCLAARRRLVFCQVVAGLMCISIPLGTALGAFTLVVLSRPSVKEYFQRPP